VRKIIKIVLIAFVAIIVIGLIGSSGNKGNSIKDAFNDGRNAAEQNLFTKEQALKKVQDYKLQVELKSPTIPKGTTILEAYEIRGKIPAIKNVGWNVTENGSGIYIVSFKANIDIFTNEPRWEVSRDTIKALNGAASTYTPELGVQPKEAQGSDFEKQVYTTASELLKKYTDDVFSKSSNPSSEQLDSAETKAISETATKYKITNEKVKEIFIKLDATKYSQ
jgi:hypothetical protein